MMPSGPWFLGFAAVLFSLGMALGGAGTATAASPPWPATSYSYYANNEPLPDVLRNFGRSVGVPVEVSQDISGTVSGGLFAPTPTDFLDRLAAAHNLVWYFDGTTVYVNTAAEQERRTIRVPDGDPTALRARLEARGLFEPRFGWTASPDGRSVSLFGPPRYVQQIAAAAAARPPQAPRAVEADVRVFPLQHAWAQDRTFYYRDKQVVVAGVVTLLRNLLDGSSGSPVTVTALPATVPGLGGSGRPAAADSAPAVAVPASPFPSAGFADPGAFGDPFAAVPAAPEIKASIQGDARLNAVVVRDRADRMGMYERLIANLDVPVALVEIEAVIIDVSTTRSSELGVSWVGTLGNVSAGFGNLESVNPDSSNIAVGVGSNLNFSTLLASGVDRFLARVNALEADGDAEVQSRPSVLTLDNLEAQLDLNQTFYVRVAGRDAVDLFPVSVGTLLRVTPHVITGVDGRRSIQLVLGIEDGSLLDREVDDIPVVQRSTINTQAVVGENESLLVGGYYHRTRSNGREAVPVLGDLPVLGLLFSQESRSDNNSERMFLIMPRIVQLGGTQAGAVPPTGPRNIVPMPPTVRPPPLPPRRP